LACAALATAPWLGAAERSLTVQAQQLAREATAAAEAQDYPKYLEKMQAAVALRPDYPRLLVNLAAAQALNDQPEEAVATLAKLAALGVHSPVEKNKAFAALRERKDFKDVVKKLAANLQNFIGEGEIAFQVPGMTGLIEGIAWREKTGQFFFGDVHHRCVWVRRAPEAKDAKSSAPIKVERFTHEGDDLFGVFGLVVDEDRGTLWAATSAVTAMEGYDDTTQHGAAGVADIDLYTGAVRRVARVTDDGRPHVIGDLALGPDGTLWLPDSGATVLWRLAPGAKEPEAFVESDEFTSLQGAVVRPDNSAVIVADYGGGLLRVDLRTRAVRPLEPPPNTTLLGIDGLVLAPTGELIAVQNGVRPNRVLRIRLDIADEAIERVEVLEAAHLNMVAPSLGCIAAGGNFFFVGNANWEHFDEPGATATAPRPVPIFRTKLAPEEPKKKK
jgi:sugar lactone lactonase YvrE